MFISDFAIRRPIVTVVAMSRSSCSASPRCAAADRRVPRHRAPIVFIGIVYPGASPGPGRARGRRPHRGPHLRHQRPRQDQLHVDRRLRADHRLLQVREADPIRRRRTSATRSPPCATSCRTEIVEPIVQRFDPAQLPIVSLALTSLTSRRRSSPRSPTSRSAASCAPIAGVAQVNVVGGDSATLDVDARPARARGRRRRRRPGRAGAARAEPRRAGRAGHRPVDRARDPARGAARATRGLRAARRRAARRPGRSGSARSPPCEAGAAEPRSAALFNGREAIGSTS